MITLLIARFVLALFIGVMFALVFAGWMVNPYRCGRCKRLHLAGEKCPNGAAS